MSRLSRFASLGGRSLIIGVGFAFALMIGGMTMNILGLPLPSFGGQPKPFQSLVSSLIAGTLTGLTLGPLSSRLRLPFLGRACLWLLLLLVLNGVINMIEALFFTTIPRAQLASSLAILAFGQVAVAVLAYPVIPTAGDGTGAAHQAERNAGTEDSSFLGVALRARCSLVPADLLLVRDDRRPLRPPLLRQPRPGFEPHRARHRRHPAA